jgi:hypothetical protein
MLAGHVGAGLALTRAAPGTNPGVLIAAALGLDVLLWALVLAGLESVHVPADYAVRRQLAFTFPCSHGLAASLGWAVLAGAAAFRIAGVASRTRMALAVAAAVLSHWALDWLVHTPDLPALGGNSAMLGLGLWDTLPAALGVEAAIAVGGLWLYLTATPADRGGKIGVAVLTLLVLALTVTGMTVAPAPPGPMTLAASSLGTIVVIIAVATWLGRSRSRVAAV